MALVRILIDGYSLLHSWPEVCFGNAPHSESAREELIRRLTLYYDAAGTPITIFFDGTSGGIGKQNAKQKVAVEVLFSKQGQTADQMIERAAHRFQPYGEVLAVTNDVAERETVLSLGGMASSCENFIREVEAALSNLADDIRHYNRKERNRFKTGRKAT